MTWLTHAWPRVLELLSAHVGLSVVAVVASLVVALPAGYLAARLPRLGGVVTSGAGLLYAIPALPLLIIVPSLVGVPLRSPANLVAALTVYGAALMVRSAADAFTAVDPEVRRGARAVGHSAWSLCWRVDLPLATPVLLAGARVLCVSTVGLVTIGALVGIPSLGTLFTDGFQRGIVAEVLTGLVATVVVGLLLDGACALLGRILTPWTRIAVGPGAGAARDGLARTVRTA